MYQMHNYCLHLFFFHVILYTQLQILLIHDQFHCFFFVFPALAPMYMVACHSLLSGHREHLCEEQKPEVQNVESLGDMHLAINAFVLAGLWISSLKEDN